MRTVPLAPFAILACLCVCACASAPPSAVCAETAAASASPSQSSPAVEQAPKKVAAIEYDLPRAGERPSDPPPVADLPGSVTHSEVASAFVVDVDADERVSIRGQRVESEQQLRQLASEAFAKDPNVRAIIRADGKASWAKVITVVDQLKQASIARLAFAVSPIAPR